MPFEMQRQVVRPGEASITVAAFEGLCPCVFAVMARQFI